VAKKGSGKIKSKGGKSVRTTAKSKVKAGSRGGGKASGS
jgi:hypothetical protein